MVLIIFSYIVMRIIRRFLKKEQIKEKVCPVCRSRKIVKADVGISEPVFARGLGQEQYRCIECGYTSALIAEEE
jgi:DNA-directed RNA polymerase subunit RPC12/RpoP